MRVGIFGPQVLLTPNAMVRLKAYFEL